MEKTNRHVPKGHAQSQHSVCMSVNSFGDLRRCVCVPRVLLPRRFIILFSLGFFRSVRGENGESAK